MCLTKSSTSNPPPPWTGSAVASRQERVCPRKTRIDTKIRKGSAAGCSLRSVPLKGKDELRLRRSAALVGQAHRLPIRNRQATRLPYNTTRCMCLVGTKKLGTFVQLLTHIKRLAPLTLRCRWIEQSRQSGSDLDAKVRRQSCIIIDTARRSGRSTLAFRQHLYLA